MTRGVLAQARAQISQLLYRSTSQQLPSQAGAISKTARKKANALAKAAHGGRGLLRPYAYGRSPTPGQEHVLHVGSSVAYTKVSYDLQPVPLTVYHHRRGGL